MQTIKITAPANGAVVKGKVPVKVSTQNVTMVIFYVDGIRVGTDQSIPFSHIVDTTTRKNGKHTIKATSGNGKVSSEIIVNIKNPVLTAEFEVV